MLTVEVQRQKNFNVIRTPIVEKKCYVYGLEGIEPQQQWNSQDIKTPIINIIKNFRQ
jgi:hypothetical protein